MHTVHLKPHCLNPIHAFKMNDAIYYLSSDHKLMWSFITYVCSTHQGKGWFSIKHLNDKLGFGSEELTEIILDDLFYINVIKLNEQLFEAADTKRFSLSVLPFTHEVVIGAQMKAEDCFRVGFGVDVPRALRLFPEGAE
ncbi:hypothetical protein AZZ82_000535 [Klebsiella aerogenes]|nr:hypothetical protein AZZ82_000535 [Klebsiella aerogenes]